MFKSWYWYTLQVFIVCTLVMVTINSFITLTVPTPVWEWSVGERAGAVVYIVICMVLGCIRASSEDDKRTEAAKKNHDASANEYPDSISR